MNRPLVRRLLLVVGTAVLLGVVAGLAWWQLAEPGQWEVRETGIALTEEQSQGEFQMAAVFTLIGAIASLAWAVTVFLPFRRHGWQMVVAVLFGASIASVIAWQVGMAVGPPEPATVPGLEVGDLVSDNLDIYSIAPFVVWPIAAMVGVLLASWGMGISDADSTDPGGTYDRDTDATTAPVNDTRS